jgi:PKD repeat protein
VRRNGSYWIYWVIVLCILTLGSTPVAAIQCTLTGHVYRGALGDKTTGMNGIQVSVYHSDNANSAFSQDLITTTTTDASGFYQLTFSYYADEFQYPYYHIWMGVPSGSRYMGAQSVGGTVGGLGIYYSSLTGKQWNGNNFWVVYPPAADFTMSPSSGMGQAPLTVYFTDRSTGNPSAWSWNFGDGQASSFQNPSHMYVTPGTYTVILSASNAAGSSSTSKTVIVQNKPALTLSPSSGPAGTRVTASGSSFNLYGIEIPSATVSFNGIVLSGNVPITRSGNLGSFTTSITIPANTAQGTYTIRAAGPLDSAEATYTVTNIPPESQINVNPLSGKSPLLVRFDGTRSLDRDGSINSYRWDFGDGTSAVGGTAEHTYTRPGRKYATLTVTDNQGAADTDAVTITVENSPPVAIASAVPESGSDPLMVTLDGSRSNDPDGTIRSFHWDFGDGSRAETSSAGHEYRNLGTYQAILTVTDDNGETGQATVQITVGNEIPVARITVSPQEGTAPLPVRFDGSESYDRDDTDLTFSWDYGDGNHGNGRTATHTYQKEGTYQVSFQVTDPHGATGRASATVRVSPPFPWWLVVIGGLGAVVGAKVVIPRVWPPTVVVPPAELPSDCEFPEPSVHVEVHSGVECELGTDGRLPDISVDIRSGIWKEDDER